MVQEEFRAEVCNRRLWEEGRYWQEFGAEAGVGDVARVMMREAERR